MFPSHDLGVGKPHVFVDKLDVRPMTDKEFAELDAESRKMIQDLQSKLRKDNRFFLPRKYMYLLVDERYHYDPDRATVFTVSETLEEAKDDKKTMFPNSVIVKCETRGEELINPEIVE